jgi:hypothetical protein
MREPEIGFLLLTYRAPGQALRLVRRLNRSFGEPAIVMHHDFGKSDFPVDELPPNVALVQPHVETGWGTFGIIDAFMAGLRLLVEGSRRPDWFFFLSGSDYPIQRAERVREELATAPADAFMSIARVNPFALGRGVTSPSFGPEWHHLAFRRWFWRDLTLPKLESGPRVAFSRRRIRYPWLPFTHGPFRNGFRCYAGEATITGNRRTAEHLLEFHATNRWLADHYRRCECPDESYLHSIMGNASALRIVNDSKRYIDWHGQHRHPRILTVDDLPKLLASSAPFARKFDVEVDGVVLDRLDELLN